jgi:hypothetical protein
MNAFVNAVKQNQTIGETFNGAVTNKTSGSAVLNFFGAAGNRSVELSKEFDLALSEDKQLAYRVALWTRDIRGGAGERQTFRNLLKHIEQHYSDDAIALLPKIPELGRWDDLLVFETDRVRKAAFNMIEDALNDRHGLAAKWMPRKGRVAEALRIHLGYTPKRYRKTLVTLSKTVEQQMCAREWDQIVFDHVPSVASARYQKAFNKHCGDAYRAYKEGLKKVNPETGQTERKINASAVFPYDVIKSVRSGDREVALAQWNALPNFLGDNKILPVVDVSGSMTSWNYYGQKANPKQTVTPLDIALSIGLYCADKQQGAFAGSFMTFSSQPTLQVLTGDLVNKINQMERSKWDMSTNIQAAFEEILKVAKTNRVSADDMPKILLILSDMEFDSCVTMQPTYSRYDNRRYDPYDRKPSKTNYENARVMFEQAGYALPTVVFWNINGRADNNPVKMHDSGTCLVSGFSPSVFKSILKTDMERYSPYNVMLDILSNERYDVVGLTK